MFGSSARFPNFFRYKKISRLELLAVGRKVINAEHVYNTMANVPTSQQNRSKKCLVGLEYFLETSAERGWLFTSSERELEIS